MFEETVKVSISQGGKELAPEKNAKYFPRLYGGTYNLCTIWTSDLTVLGGTWGSVVGGSHSAYQYGGTKVTFGGSAQALDGLYGGGSSNTGALSGDVSLTITGGTVSGKLVIGGSGKFLKPGYNISMTVTGKPDLSGVRIINAGGDAEAASVVMDLGQFQNAGDQFTAYFNEAEYTKIVPAPAPAASFPVVMVIIAAVVVAAAGGAAVLVMKKKKTQVDIKKEEEV